MSEASPDSFPKLLSVSLLAALIYLLYANIGPMSALWQRAHSEVGEARLLKPLQAADAEFIAAADGGDLALRFESFDPRDPDQTFFLSKTYFRAVYTMYPRQVVLGTQSRIINNGIDALQADELLFDPWLREHHIKASLVLHGEASPNIRTEYRPVLK